MNFFQNSSNIFNFLNAEDEQQAHRPRKGKRQRREAAGIPKEYTTPITTRFIPKTPNQERMVSVLKEGRQIVFAIGSAGTGKSIVACHHAASLLKKKEIEKVFLLRPNVATGKTLGYLKGDLKEKMLPFLQQTLAHLEKFLGVSMFYHMKNATIEFAAIEHCRGKSFENCVVIVEESQNMTRDEFEMLLTRVGENCQLIFTGDERQNDLGKNSGLVFITNLVYDVLEQRPSYLDNEDLKELCKNLAVIRFTEEDIVRGGLCKAFVKIFNRI